MVSPPILVLAMAQKARGHLDAHLLHALLGDAAADFHHAQGDNEGWQLAIGNQRAVDHADQGAHDQRGGDADDIRPWTRNANRGQQAGGVAVDDHHQHRPNGPSWWSRLPDRCRRR